MSLAVATFAFTVDEGRIVTLMVTEPANASTVTSLAGTPASVAIASLKAAWSSSSMEPAMTYVCWMGARVRFPSALIGTQKRPAPSL